MKFIVGKKVGMSRILEKDKMIPVTLVSAENCVVTQIKDEKKDGYNAIQIGIGRKKNINKPEKGHLKKLEKELQHISKLIELRVDEVENYKVGQKIEISDFASGDYITVSGISKGKGFTGVVKRHGFKGSPKTHGHRHDERAPGSIGSRFPQHTLKGIRMAGRHGNKKTSIKNLQIIQVDKDNNLIAISGALPGARNTLLTIVAK